MVQLAELQQIDDFLDRRIKPKGISSLRKLEDKKTKIEERLETRTLRYYYRVREKHDDAVVPLDGGHCSICGMQIPALIQQDIRNNIGVNVCANCGRILVWDPK